MSNLHHFSTFIRLFVLFIPVVSLVGCGGDAGEYEGPKRFAVSGKITFDGEPIDGGVISFTPDAENLRPTGGVITNGEYSVPAPQGANAGSYHVEIRWGRSTGKQFKDPDTGEMLDEKQQVIPSNYNDVSELTAVVTEDPEKNVFNFDLKSK